MTDWWLKEGRRVAALEKRQAKFKKTPLGKKNSRINRALKNAELVEKYGPRPELITKSYPRNKYKNKYNMNLNALASIYRAQNGQCAICLGEINLYGRRRVLDRNLAGYAHGLLCRACKNGIANFQRDPVLLERAVRYIEESPVSTDVLVRLGEKPPKPEPFRMDITESASWGKPEKRLVSAEEHAKRNTFTPYEDLPPALIFNKKK